MDCWWKGVLQQQGLLYRIQNVTLALSPVVFEWPLDYLSSECRTHRSLYRTWMKLQVRPTAVPTTAENSAEASCLSQCSGLDLLSAFLLCKLSNNQHPWEWDIWHFLKTHTLNYKSTYEWKNLCLRPGGVGGVVLLLGTSSHSVYLLNFGKRQVALSQKEIYWRF